MIIITPNPAWDGYRDENIMSFVFHGTNDPRVAFREFLRKYYEINDVDSLTNDQLIALTVNNGHYTYAEYWNFSVIPSSPDEEFRIEELSGVEVIIDTDLETLFAHQEEVGK